MAASERRLLVSYQAASDAGGGGPVSAVGRDAALGGLFIETRSPLPVGALLSVEVSSPGTSATLEARVFSIREANEGPTKPAGMAVRFLDLPQGMLGKLQTILDHHRPPARTRLGVGDENEALWASAGGRDDDMMTDDEVLAIAASLAVDGRPTPEMPSPTVDEPKPPRHPTPRMIPLTPPPVSHRSWSAPPMPPSVAPPPPVAPPFAPPPSAQPRPSKVGLVVAALVVTLLVAAMIAVRWLR